VKPPRDEPVPLRDALAEVGRDLGMPDPGVLERVTVLWREVVGPAVAEHTDVRSVRDGVCTVTADAPVWATQLRYLEQAVLDRVAEVLGPGFVRGVKVVVAPPTETF
jgi:predicted nucleic acid-binding Zn ribbon protein